MGVASLVVAICGAVLACLSLGWQAVNYVLTGGRVKTTIRVGAMGEGNVLTHGPVELLSVDWLRTLEKQGFTRPVITLTVANVGRQPVTVAHCGLSTAVGARLYASERTIGPRMPHRLDVGQAATWVMGLGAAINFRVSTQKIVDRRRARFRGPVTRLRYRRQERQGIRGVVQLADGRVKLTHGRFRYGGLLLRSPNLREAAELERLLGQAHRDAE